ncbi:MAG: hypothetical protein HC904_02895, partial [Blastochloris sp.]|nr:hypothetical protein [Blastochloris sp.]
MNRTLYFRVGMKRVIKNKKPVGLQVRLVDGKPVLQVIPDSALVGKDEFEAWQELRQGEIQTLEQFSNETIE